jgi:DNA-binding GntR family transcriptional regulator
LAAGRYTSEILESEGLVWAVPKRGTIVRHGMVRPHRMRGNLVKRNHITPTAKPEKLIDARIARLLKVPEGSEVLLRHRVTGPEAEPPFQVNNSWIHPRVPPGQAAD